MKAQIHPQWHDDTVVTCACGNTFTTGSTQKAINVDICSACHPLFTGEARLIDTVGRIERFEKMRLKAQAAPARKKTKFAPQEDRTLSLKEMIEAQKKQSVTSN